jgi:hypothetical protein
MRSEGGISIVQNPVQLPDYTVARTEHLFLVKLPSSFAND